MFLDEKADQLGGVLSEIDRAEASPQGEVSFLKLPFGEGAELLFEIEGENRLADVEQIDSAAEFAGTGFGDTMRALGDDAHEAVLSSKDGENLAGLAELDLTEADAAIGTEGHRRIIGAGAPSARQRCVKVAG